MDQSPVDPGAPLDRDVLAAFPPMEPAPDFAARVLAAVDGSSPDGQAETSRRRRWSFTAAGAAVIAAALILLLLARGAETQGEALVASRTTLSLGRAVLVLESGADISYTVARRGGTAVQQRAGSVFYRVDRKGSFAVQTPVARIEVTGTCFRVEVPTMLSRRDVKTAAIAAAATAAITVTVYEGKVLVSNDRGSVALAAGEAARIEEDEPPSRTPSEDRHPSGVPAEADGEKATTSMALAARDQEQERELTKLRLRVKEFEELQAKTRMKEQRDAEQWSGVPSQEELLRRAKNCTLRWDMPNLYAGPELPEGTAKWFGANEEEQAIMNEARAALHERFSAQLRQLYVEVTGDQRSSEILSLAAMQAEIQHKAPKGEERRVFRRLSAEKAGLAPAPADLSGASPYERLMRILTTMGDDYERALAKELGPERARAMRVKNGGQWENNSGSTVCP